MARRTVSVTFRLAVPFAALVLATLGIAGLARATTFVMVPDAELARQAPLIVEARILGSQPAQIGDLPATDSEVEVLRVLKGEAPVGPLVVRVPGGAGLPGADGKRVGLEIWGAPRFAAGERAILFLERAADGTFRILHLLLGAFHEIRGSAQVDGVEAGGSSRRLAFRDLEQTTELRLDERGDARFDDQPSDLPRDFDRFAAWLAAGARGPADYFVPAEAAAPLLAQRYVLLAANDGKPIRWFDFDGGGAITFEANSQGQPGLPGGGFAQLQAALAMWTNDPLTDIRMFYGGTTAGTATGCASPSRVLRLVFDDPQNEISGAYSCSSGGGVLALGGPCFEQATRFHNGTSYHAALDGYVVTNDGLACFFERQSNPQRTAEELFAHETGHTLGLGHTTVTSGLMYAFLHNDGRGATLSADDRAAIAVLYGDGSPPPPPPAAPSNLTATAQSSSQIRLEWQDNATTETGYRVERRTTGAFSEIASLPADATSYPATGLAAATAYEFRVRAVNDQGFSGYSNTAAATTPGAGPTPPAAPSNLTATAVSTAEIRLAWRDNASNETGYRVERRSYSGFTEIASLPFGATGFSVIGLVAATPYEFRVRAVNAQGFSSYSNIAAAITRGVASPCVADETLLCLLGGALRVEVQWKNQHASGALGIGHAAAISSKSGSFWFFSPDNVELLVKALDGGAVNGKYWFFYGALSDVEYWIRVTQTATGEVAVYHNPPGEICGGADTTALPRALAQLGGGTWPPGFGFAELPADDLVPEDATEDGATTATCVASPETLCLLSGRFEVKVDWSNPRNGTSGTGKIVPLSDRTGYFWFFDAANLELVVKALDGRAQNGKFWFFYGALSDVAYHVRVRDTVSGTTRVYDNPAGEICGLGDTQAF